MVTGNVNAPEAVTYSAIIYCLRCLISEDIPLNQGCLKPIDVRIPSNSLLSPSESAAVVGGNVLTVSFALASHYTPDRPKLFYTFTNSTPPEPTSNRRNPQKLSSLCRLPG